MYYVKQCKVHRALYMRYTRINIIIIIIIIIIIYTLYSTFPHSLQSLKTLNKLTKNYKAYGMHNKPAVLLFLLVTNYHTIRHTPATKVREAVFVTGTIFNVVYRIVLRNIYYGHLVSTGRFSSTTFSYTTLTWSGQLMRVDIRSEADIEDIIMFVTFHGFM